jgi:hypothetical protein
VKTGHGKIWLFLIAGYVMLCLVGCGGADPERATSEGNDGAMPRAFMICIFDLQAAAPNPFSTWIILRSSELELLSYY